MGEIAEDMIQGRVCMECSGYFVNPDSPDELARHGYQVICRDCWDRLIDDGEIDEDQEVYEACVRARMPLSINYYQDE